MVVNKSIESFKKLERTPEIETRPQGKIDLLTKINSRRLGASKVYDPPSDNMLTPMKPHVMNTVKNNKDKPGSKGFMLDVRGDNNER